MRQAVLLVPVEQAAVDDARQACGLQLLSLFQAVYLLNVCELELSGLRAVGQQGREEM